MDCNVFCIIFICHGLELLHVYHHVCGLINMFYLIMFT